MYESMPQYLTVSDLKHPYEVGDYHYKSPAYGTAVDQGSNTINAMELPSTHSASTQEF